MVAFGLSFVASGACLRFVALVVAVPDGRPWPSCRLPDLPGRSRPDAVETAEDDGRSEEHTSELQSLMRISYAVFCLKKKNQKTHKHKSKKKAPTHTKQKQN